MIDSSGLKPLADVDGGPVFDEAWQAQALALADTLVDNGLFSASAWSDALGSALKKAEISGDVDSHETYYRCVLRALEALVATHSDIDHEAMKRMRKNWEFAYRSTAHGQPVVLLSR